jgi:hypothetical protein
MFIVAPGKKKKENTQKPKEKKGEFGEGITGTAPSKWAMGKLKCGHFY